MASGVEPSGEWSSTVSGQCVCGGVSFELTGSLRSVSNCHCQPCRRFTGHHMAATATATTDIRFVTDGTLTWYRSAPEVEYGFCSTCGASLFWRSFDRPEVLSVCAGVLEQPTGLATTTALFLAEHGDYHSPEPVSEQFSGDRP